MITLTGASLTANTGTGWADVQVTKAADANYGAKASAAVRVNFAKADQTIAFANPGTQKALVAIPLTATAPGGTVTFSVASGPATVSGSTLTLTGYGTVNVTAAQSGNANYNAAASVGVSFLVKNTPPVARIRAATTSRIFGQAFEFFTDARDVDNDLVTVAGYVRGPGTYTPASPWGSSWTTVMTNTFAATGNQTGKATYLPPAVGSYNYCGSAVDSAGGASTNIALTAWADWNAWNTVGTNNSVGTFTVTPAAPIGTFPALSVTGPHTLSAGDLNANFANPYSTAVAPPGGTIGFSIVSASGPSASPTSGPISAGTILQPGVYVLRASYSGDGNYSAATVDSQFIVSTTVVANDTDGNGLDDTWEQTYFGHLGVDPNAVNANGVSYIDAYNSWQAPSLATANGFNNEVINIPVSMTVIGRGTGTVTLTDNGHTYVFKFVATSGNPWTTPTLDVAHPEYVGTYEHSCNYGSPDTIQVSASGVIDYFITAKLAPELHPQLNKALVEINGKVVDGIMPSEIVGNAFVLRARPGGQLPFGTLDSSHLQVNHLLEFGMGGSRSGRTAGRILLSPTASGTVNIDKGDAMEGFVQSAVHFQAKVPAGYVDLTRTYYRISIRYYFDATPFTGVFRDFTGVTPDAAYSIDTIPSGPTGAAPRPVRLSATSWNPAGSQRCVITRTVGGVSHIFELESYSLIAPNQGAYSSPYEGPGGGFVTVYANFYSSIVRMWPWRLANAPRGGLIRAEFSHVDTVVQYPMGVPNTGYGTNELDMTSYLGATEASAVGDYEYRNSVPLDYAMLRAIPLTRGLGDDQYDLPHNTSVRAGPVTGLNLAQDLTQYENGFGGGSLTEYLSGSADINGANNLAGQAQIALGQPKSVRTSFGDSPVLSASDLISNYTYGQDPVDGSAVPTNVVTTQGTTQVGAISYLYATGTFNSLPTLAITATQSTSPTASLTTTTFSYSRRTADPDLRGKTLSLTRPDSTKTSYAYQRGTLSGSTWTADVNGPHFLTAELTGKIGTTLTSYGTAPIDGLDLDPSRSSVSETITDQAGHVLREASYVYQNGGTFALLNATYSTYDGLGNLVLKADQPGANPTGRIFYEAGFNGFQKAWESDEQGITRTYHYDAYDRVDWMKRSSASASGIAIAETKTSYLYDALGRLQQEAVSSEGEGDQLVTSYTYDTASRPKANTTPGGLVTSIVYDSPTQTTTILPGGGTKIAVSYLDGRSKSVTGSAVPDSATSYAYDGAGNLKTTQTTAGQTGTQTTDWAGRTISADAATSSGGTRTTSNTYNSLGQLVKQEVRSGGVSVSLPHLYQYDAYGRLYREGMAIGAHDLPDPATDFGVKEYETAFQTGAPGDAANWYLYTGQKIWPYAGTNAGTFRYASQSYTQISGLTATLAAHSIALDFDRNRTETTSTVDRAHQTLTNATTTAGTNQTITQVSLNGLPIVSTNAQGQTTIMTYDGLGRLESTNDPRIGMSSVLYYPNTTFVEYAVAPDFQITSYGYDAAGHVSSQANNNNKWAYFQYDQAGNLTHTWGDTTNPVHYEYNELGQKTKMHTYRAGTWTGAGLPGGFSAEGDVTTWNYQASTGLLNSKVDALSQTTSYQYDAMGRSTQRTDGRGWVTNYSYTAAGQPWVTSYTDGITPSVTFAYDRAGRVQTVDDAAGRRSFAYYDGWSDATYDNDLLNKSARLKSETLPAYFGSHVLNYGYQYSVAGRANGAQNSLSIDSGSLYAVGYGYDDVGRPQTVSYNAITPFSYTYVPNSNLVDTVAQGTTGYKRDYDYEATSNRVSTLRNQFASIAASTVEDRLTYDFLGQRDTEKIVGTAWMTTLGRGSEAGVHADYEYTDRSELEYSAKYQLTSDWGVGGFKATTDRTYNYDPIGNRTSDIIGGVAGSYTPNDLNQYTSAPVAGSMTYDGNGNLKADGTRLYDYDGENRLITVTQGASVWHYEYDYLNRRIRKYGTGLTEQRFIYDGWNLIAETDGSGNLTRRYAWGLDVSGTLQDAGGVGGLLIIQDGSNSYYPLYDASHNVIGLYNGAGAVDSAYEYDPFGRQQSSVGAYAVANPFRFSTKYTDNETNFAYYGLRYYSPLLGRFINRDPIQEAGGINLYGFCGNDAVNVWDYLGMDDPATPLDPIVVHPDQDADRQADRDREQTKTDYGNSLLDSLPKFDNKLGFTLQLSLGDAAAKSQLSTIGMAYNNARLRAKSAKQMRGFWRTIADIIVHGIPRPPPEQTIEQKLEGQAGFGHRAGIVLYSSFIEPFNFKAHPVKATITSLAVIGMFLGIREPLAPEATMARTMTETQLEFPFARGASVQTPGLTAEGETFVRVGANSWNLNFGATPGGVRPGTYAFPEITFEAIGENPAALQDFGDLPGDAPQYYRTLSPPAGTRIQRGIVPGYENDGVGGVPEVIFLDGF